MNKNILDELYYGEIAPNEQKFFYDAQLVEKLDNIRDELNIEAQK